MPDPCGQWQEAPEREALLQLHARMLWAALNTVSVAVRSRPFEARELKRYCKEAIWAVTELRVGEKYDLRYVSAGVVAACKIHGPLRTWMRRQGQGVPKLNHEHVITKDYLNRLLLKADSSSEVVRVLRTAIGCTVTETEHGELHGALGEGWARYAGASIAVWDRLEGKWREGAGKPPKEEG